MSWADDFLRELHGNLVANNARDFEEFLFLLLAELGFQDTELLQHSGDGGIDLRAIWKQTEIPGLEIDLPYVIQAKCYDPSRTLPIRYVRELRGTLEAGEWGLLVTTARVSSTARAEGQSQTDRIVNIIDGQQLVSLCTQYNVAAKKTVEYHFDSNYIPQPEESTVELVAEVSTESINPRDKSDLLYQIFGDPFTKIGNTSIYSGGNRRIIARWSKRYSRETQTFWYGLTLRDISNVEDYGVTHFGYFCSNEGIVVFQEHKIKDYIDRDVLLKTLKQNGDLRHYHIYFAEDEGHLFLIMKGGQRENIDDFYRIFE